MVFTVVYYFVHFATAFVLLFDADAPPPRGALSHPGPAAMRPVVLTFEPCS